MTTASTHYTINLTLLLTLALTLFLVPRLKSQSQSKSKSKSKPGEPNPNPNPNPNLTPRSLASFLAAYTLAVSSDWLQGPFLYPLYRDEHGLRPGGRREQAQRALFATGFVAAAAAGAAGIGAWADRRGRRRACLVFCAAYAASCLLAAHPTAVGLPLSLSLSLLLLSSGGDGGGGDGGDGGRLKVAGLAMGRVLGGVGTALLFCAFESWLVGEVAARRHGRRGRDGDRDGDRDADADADGQQLGKVLGVMSGLNSAAAIACGVLGEW